MNARRIFRIGGGYGLSVVISGLVSIAVIPAVIIVAGDDLWATVAVAQAVAGFAFVVVVYGWGIIGPTSVAALPKAQRGTYYLGTLVSRTWLFAITVVPSIVITLLLDRTAPLVAILVVATSTAAGLGAAWFYVGESSPLRYLFYDTIPRSAATALGALLLITTREILWFAGLQLLGVLIAVVAGAIDIARRHPGDKVDLSPRAAFARLAGQTSAVAMSATSAVYVNLPIVFIQIFLPQATAVYALGERIMRLALYATRPVVQIFQGYVPSEQRGEQVRRAQFATRIAILIGVIGFVGYAAAGPTVGHILSGGRLEVGFDLTIPLGLALGAILVTQVTGFACLTSFNETRTLAISTIVGSIAGAVLLVPAALLGGAVGVAYVLAASELVVLAFQLVKLREILRTAID